MTKIDEIKALLEEIRDRLPEPEGVTAPADDLPGEPVEPGGAVLAERIAWKDRHAALRADVEDARRNPETLTRLLMRLADTLDRDDAEVRAEGGDDE